MATILDAPPIRPRATVTQAGFAIALVFAAAVLLLLSYRAIAWAAPGELVWPLSPNLWAAVVFVTTFLLILAAARMVARRRAAPFGDTRRSARATVDVFVAAPALLLIAVSATARLTVQLVGFAGLQPAAATVPFTVVGSTHSFSHGRDYYRLRLRYGAGGRTFSDPVDRAVYDAARDGDTVALPVETGRFGLQRAMVAAPLTPTDLHHPA